LTTTTTTTEILTQAFTKILTEIYNLVHRKNPSINTKPTVAPTSTEVTLSLPLFFFLLSLLIFRNVTYMLLQVLQIVDPSNEPKKKEANSGCAC
jgi:hypothetical protein